MRRTILVSAALLLSSLALAPMASAAANPCDGVPLTQPTVWACAGYRGGEVGVIFWEPAACWDGTSVGPVTWYNCVNALYVTYDL